MKIINRSEYNLSHGVIEEVKVGEEVRQNQKNYYLPIGEMLDVPQEVADTWLKIKGVEKYIDPEELKKQLRAEIEAEIKQENTKKARAKKG